MRPSFRGHLNTGMNDEAEQTMMFYATIPDVCPYLGDREMVSVFADPHRVMNHGVYDKLIELGFRRSGEHVYRHQCRGCSACKPMRIPVDAFTPDRSQRRVMKRHAATQVRLRDPIYDPQHFELYQRYVNHRHLGGGMDNPTPESYWAFISSSWCQTWLVEFLVEGRLVCVAVTDRMKDGLSAVYTFFEPELGQLAPGTNAILWQIQEAQRRGLSYLYLGYWNDQTPKMAYKTRFGPAEYLEDGFWKPLDRLEPDAPVRPRKAG